MARYAIPEGWVVQAYRYALDPTPAQERGLVQHVGAARFAFNHMLALVKAVLDQRSAERSYGVPEEELTPSLNWSMSELRRVWNQRKDIVAPWWRSCSKEAYSSGIDGLARGLDAWAHSKAGTRGRHAGFPTFKVRGRARDSVRFTTGPLRIEPDRHHVTLPKIGAIRTHESTRKLARRLEQGDARILSATVSRGSSGRWFCAFQTLVRRDVGRPAHIRPADQPVVGVDLGVRDLLVVAAPDGEEVLRIAAPRPLQLDLANLRRLNRRLSRQMGPGPGTAPSRRWQRTNHRVALRHAHAANVRRDTIHKATTALAQRHQVIVVETLSLSALSRAGGKSRNRRRLALHDAALAEVRRMLKYKTEWYGSALVEADRFYPSSKTCSGCGGRKPSLSLSERSYTCDDCGLTIDRDQNAAINLARLGLTYLGETSTAGSESVAGRGAIHKTGAAEAEPAGGVEASTLHGQLTRQTGIATSKESAA